MTLLLRGKPLHSVLGFIDADENSASFAMDLALDMRPAISLLGTATKRPRSG